MSSAASASPSRRRSTHSIARAWTSRARWAATSSTSARPPRRLPRPTPARAAGHGHAHQSRRAHRPTTTCSARTAHGLHAAPPGYGRGRQLHRHRHRRGSDSCRRLVHRRGRGHRDRRPVHDSPDARCAHGHRAWRSPIRRGSPPRRRSARPRPPRNTGTGTVSSGEVLDPTNAATADHGQHRLHFRDYLLGERRRKLHLHAGLDIDVNGWRIQVNGAPAIGDRFTVRSNAGADRRQSQRFRAGRCHEGQRARRRHEIRVSAPSSGSPPTWRPPRAPRRSARDAESHRSRQRRRLRGFGVGRQPRRRGGQHAALPAGLCRRGADHLGGATRCSTRCINAVRR